MWHEEGAWSVRSHRHARRSTERGFSGVEKNRSKRDRRRNIRSRGSPLMKPARWLRAARWRAVDIATASTPSNGFSFAGRRQSSGAGMQSSKRRRAGCTSSRSARASELIVQADTNFPRTGQHGLPRSRHRAWYDAHGRLLAVFDPSSSRLNARQRLPGRGQYMPVPIRPSPRFADADKRPRPVRASRPFCLLEYTRSSRPSCAIDFASKLHDELL